MALRLKANGCEESPRRALEQLSRIQRHRIAIDGIDYEGLSRIEPAQRDLYKALGLSAPRIRQT